MNYEGNIIRPPSEADAIILQVTVGCSHNKCTFCGVYKDTQFRIKESEIIEQDISFARQYCKRQKSVFLCDGDALILPHDRLVCILEQIKEKLPWVRKVSLYGNARSIRLKTDQELKVLKEKGLRRIYLGLESGHAQVLKNICKGESPESMIEAAQKVRSAGLFLSVTVLLGIGGEILSQAHAKETGRLLGYMKPHQIAALTLMVLPNTDIHKSLIYDNFKLPSPVELLLELKTLIENIELDKAQFFSNHSSNYLPLSGRLKRDKKEFIQQIDQALSGKSELKPEFMRAL